MTPHIAPGLPGVFRNPRQAGGYMARTPMNPTIPNTPALLRELRNLGLVDRDRTEHLAACDDPHACTAMLVESRALTAFQADQVLAGRGRTLHVGPYVLQERLGRGGMGHVYKAEHRLLKRVVALKIAGRVRRDGGDLAALARFRREVEAAGRLQHPSIVTAYDAGEANGWLYLAMEYIEGIDLEQFVRETGPLPVDLACEIVRQTAEALGHAHEAGLIHRDIKPSNLMLAPPGVTVKLLDLGLAQLTDTALSVDQRSAGEGELCGTPDFMAPEWGRDPRALDARSDLYSLGCTFYYLLAGQVPFPGGSWTEKLLRHSLEAPPCVSELRPDVPEEIAAVVARLMAREREDRYPCAADVVAALRPNEKKVVAGRARRDPKARRFSCGAVAAILLGVAAAGGARWIVTPPPPVTTIAAPREEARKESPFTIEGHAAGFASLEKTVAAARDGETITVHGAGPFVSRPLSWQGKALTVRSDGTARPRLELKTGNDPWQALFRTDRPLTLEGLDMALAQGSSEAPLIYCEQASLHLTDCRVMGGAEEVAIVARNPEEVLVSGCRIEAGAVGLSVEVGANETCRLKLVKNHLTARGALGAALSLWAQEVRRTTAVRVELEDNTIQAGRMAALRALPPNLTIAARGNRFTYRSALLSYSGYAKGTAWRDADWQGNNNSCVGPAAWLWIDDRPAMEKALPR